VANRGIANEVTLIDVVPGVAEATALDLNHASGITRSGAHVQGGTDLSLIADAQVVVITAGRPRSPGMSRADLMTINRRIIQSISESVRTHAPDSIVIVVTNPLDEMTMTVLEATGFPYHRVLGMAGTLDSSRFRWSLAQKAGVPVSDVEAVTLGSHGGEMVPIVSTALIRNKPVTTVLSDDEIRDCVETTVHGGESVVALRKTGSATLAPAHAVCELLDAIRGARPGSLPVSVMLNGSYGIHDVVLGVPCVLDSSGLREIIELSITDEEQALLEAAAESVRSRLGQAANTNI
jgi:malate dehydrogenase